VFSFNLIDSKWIPCILPGGDREELSIKETFERASEIQEIFDPSPLVTVAIHRLLLAILHRNFGPANETEWAKLWNDGKGDWDKVKLTTYLDKWHSRFDLFDEKYPFYQCTTIPVSTTDAKGKPKSYAKSVSNMVHELATGDNATLFDHSIEDNPRALSSAEAARLLVAFQSFAVGGLITFESGQDRRKFGSADNAPLVKGAIIFVEGDNLLQTLMLNLHKYNRNDAVPFEIDRNDTPVWEREENLLREERPKGLLDLLTWQSRRLKLMPEQDNNGRTIVTQAVIMKGNQFPDGFYLYNKEPMLAFRKVLKPSNGQDPYPPLAFQQEKALWRDSLSLFKATENSKTKPKIIVWLSYLAEEDKIPWSNTYHLAVMGLVTSKAKVSLWRHERLPLPLKYLEEKNENLLGKLRDALDVAENVGRLLSSGFVEIEIKDKKGGRKNISVPSPLRILASNILKPDKPEKADKDAVSSFINSLSPSRPYWANLGISFNELLIKLPADKTEENEYGKTVLSWWAKEIRQAACNAFEETTNSFDRSARMLKAVTLAENEFHNQLDKILKNIETKGGDKS
jgi:CRISPR system Cascade subunit CasA